MSFSKPHVRDQTDRSSLAGRAVAQCIKQMLPGIHAHEKGFQHGLLVSKKYIQLTHCTPSKLP